MEFDYIVEIADELDGFVIISANNADDAERQAEELGYQVLYAHLEDY